MSIDKRDYYFDNAKLVLIFLVVLGHSIRPFTGTSDIAKGIYTFIYLFHMPAFVLISGYFTKKNRAKGHYRNLFLKLMLPYIVFEMLYALFLTLLNGKRFDFDLLNPYWLLWFLFSLFCWHLLLPVFTRIRYGMVLSFLIAVVIGYADFLGKEYGIIRTLTFFPFFLLGHYLKKEHFEMLKKPYIRITSIAFLSWMALYIATFNNLHFRFLWSSKPYSVGGFYGVDAAATRMEYFLLTLFMCISFFALVPKRKFSISHLGAYTLSIYLLHGFFVKLFIYKLDWFDSDSFFFTFMGVLLFSTVVCLVTVHPVTRKYVSWLLEPANIFKHLTRNTKNS